MERNGSKTRRDDAGHAHITTRRGFITAVGFSVVTLYGLWAAYGAAPTSLQFLTDTQSEGTAGMAMGGHGAGAGGMTPEEFHEITEKFVEDLSLPDGSVRPMRQWMPSMAAMAGAHEGREDEANEHRAMGEAMKAGEAARMASSAETIPAVGREEAEEEGHDSAQDEEPIDVYLMAMQFYYLPNVLRLERGVPYRFRMMSMEVNHGASIHTGFAGHIMRRPAQMMSEMVMTFPEPGEFMIYCTVYCGVGHSRMKGKIIVE
jgi:heme/copper-type cytochrome/quinol oxidase subunit 2